MSSTELPGRGRMGRWTDKMKNFTQSDDSYQEHLGYSLIIRNDHVSQNIMITITYETFAMF